jgi:hypothetical protein
MTIKNRKNAALIIGLAIVASLVMASSGSRYLENLAGVPAIVGCVSALFMLTRDHIAHERSLFLQEAGQGFSMGGTSHMANTAFDKHVLFCEEYSTAMLEIVHLLYRNGPNRDGLEYSVRLADIRGRWNLWLTPAIETELSKFEFLLRKMGAEGLLADGLKPSEAKAAALERMNIKFAEITGMEHWDKEKVVSRDVSASTVLVELRKILGTEEFTKLRAHFVERALKNLEG